MILSSMEAGCGRLLRRANRKSRAVAHFALLLCAGASAQSPTDAQLCDDFEQYRYIRTVEPARPNQTLRQDNITDEEVREVQKAALEVYPDSIVSISGVTDGCDCEDGSRCTAQVWLALSRENQTRSLVLSKIDGRWKIGAVQSWSLQYIALQAKFPGFGVGAKQTAWHQAKQRLLDSFPTCPAPSAEWMTVKSDGHFSTCVDITSMQVSGFIRRVNFKSMYPPMIHPLRTQFPGFPWHRYVIDLMAFDCKDHRERIDRIDTYYDDGTVTKSPGKDPVLWDPIRAGTDAASDWDLVCGWGGK
jgi:hypothetical protein